MAHDANSISHLLSVIITPSLYNITHYKNNLPFFGRAEQKKAAQWADEKSAPLVCGAP
jgi:hypothetical protein